MRRAALALGRLFDRVGFGAVAPATLAAAAAPPLVFLGGMGGAAAGMALWGIGLGAQESIMRAAWRAWRRRRGTAYGLFNATAWRGSPAAPCSACSTTVPSRPLSLPRWSSSLPRCRP